MKMMNCAEDQKQATDCSLREADSSDKKFKLPLKLLSHQLMENFLFSVLGNPTPLLTAGFAGFPSLSPSQLMASLQLDLPRVESTQV